MTLVGKSLHSITKDDLQNLVDAGARETAVLEFKGALPVASIKGGPTVDRWIEHGDRIGDYARDQLLAEIVAFANADGGTLVLGVQETTTEPRCASGLSPLPNCERLAKRLLDAAEDIVEPRLLGLAAQAIPADTAGAGFVLLRTGKSLFGPHRLTTTRDFYVRRGERTAKMTAREIRDHSLSLARTGDQIRAIFEERLDLAKRRFEVLMLEKPQPAKERAPFLIRVSAAPLSPQYIDRLTGRPTLWWIGGEFTMVLDGSEYPCPYPAREFGERPDFRLRSLVRRSLSGGGGIERLLTARGLVEFSFWQPWRNVGVAGEEQGSLVYFGWIYGLVVGVYAQVRHLQSALAWDAVDFGLNVSVFAKPPLSMHWRKDGWGQAGLLVKDDLPLNLPQYEIGPTTSVDHLLTDITQDISNACGSMLTVKCSVPAEAQANCGSAANPT